jgi:hypothetical protein
MLYLLCVGLFIMSRGMKMRMKRLSNMAPQVVSARSTPGELEDTSESTHATSNSARKCLKFTFPDRVAFFLEGERQGDSLPFSFTQYVNLMQTEPPPPPIATTPSNVPTSTDMRVISRHDQYLLNAVHRSCASAGMAPSIHNVSKALTQAQQLRKEVKDQRETIAALKQQVEKAEARSDKAAASLETKLHQVKNLQQQKRRQSDKIDSLKEEVVRLETFYHSPEYVKETARQFVVSQILKDDGRQYQEHFKQGWAHFSQKCTSLRGTKPAAQILFEAVGLPDLKLPDRSRTTTFKVIEAEAGVQTWPEELTSLESMLETHTKANHVMYYKV